jgi:hypothetical protein
MALVERESLLLAEGVQESAEMFAPRRRNQAVRQAASETADLVSPCPGPWILRVGSSLVTSEFSLPILEQV